MLPKSSWIPIVFDAPHCGREYPKDFRSILPFDKLRQGEDAYIDELISDAPELGIPVLAACFPRTYLDPNRSPEDIDPELLKDTWPSIEGSLQEWAEVGVSSLKPSIKSRRGIGLIWKDFEAGGVLYDRKLPSAEILQRIRDCYLPYHKTLDKWLNQLRSTYSNVWHINWHSMKSLGNKNTPDKPGTLRPDMVLGDLHGKSCKPEFTEVVLEGLTDLGYQVSVNDPYAGAWILERCSDPLKGIHCLQIEIRRDLYMDEISLECHEGFSKLRKDFINLFRVIKEFIESKNH